MSTPQILVAGVGNIFLGDDAFGGEVVKRLAAKRLPPGVEVVDFGISGLDLTYALLAGWETAILVDAIPRGQAPGTLYVVAPALDETCTDDANEVLIEAHNLDPAKVLRLVRRLGGRIKRLLLVGCEPTPLEEDEMREGLSDAVAAAVEEAVKVVLELIKKNGATLAPDDREKARDLAAC